MKDYICLWATMAREIHDWQLLVMEDYAHIRETERLMQKGLLDTRSGYKSPEQGLFPLKRNSEAQSWCFINYMDLIIWKRLL